MSISSTGLYGFATIEGIFGARLLFLFLQEQIIILITIRIYSMMSRTCTNRINYIKHTPYLQRTQEHGTDIDDISSD
jgi:hypothetical protein